MFSSKDYKKNFEMEREEILTILSKKKEYWLVILEKIVVDYQCEHYEFIKNNSEGFSKLAAQKEDSDAKEVIRILRFLESGKRLISDGLIQELNFDRYVLVSSEENLARLEKALDLFENVFGIKGARNIFVLLQVIITFYKNEEFRKKVITSIATRIKENRENEYDENLMTSAPRKKALQKTFVYLKPKEQLFSFRQ